MDEIPQNVVEHVLLKFTKIISYLSKIQQSLKIFIQIFMIFEHFIYYFL